LVGAALFGTFSVGWQGGKWFFGASVGALIGFVVGAIFGDRFLEWLSKS
jgi:hypothetical protein